MSRQATSRASVELFAGAGGLGIGLAQAGFEPKMVVEFNKWCCNTLRDNHCVLAEPGAEAEAWKVIEGDIRKVDFKFLEGTLDIISGGPPCQPFSLGGNHRAYDDARDMFPQAVRAVREARPRAFIFENVKGLTRASFHDYYTYIQLQLEHPEVMAHEDEAWTHHRSRLEQHHTSKVRTGLNYRVLPRLLNAAEYGVPQRRERVVFVGFRDDFDARWTLNDGGYSQKALVWDQVFGDYWERHKVAKADRILEGRAAQMSKRLRSTRNRIRCRGGPRVTLS